MGQNINVVDPLYPSYSLPLGDMIEHEYVVRAKGVGLSAIPPQWVRGEHFNGRSDPSQFEHGCGVARLAAAISARNKIRAPDFVVAAFLHDISQPAFSHIGEQRLRGYNPHARAAQMVLEPSLAALVEKAGADPQAVAAAIKGEGLYGPLLSGALDLDHLDGTLRYAMRYGVFQKKPYDALEIAGAFIRTPQGWVLDAAAVPHLERWRSVMERNCRLAYGVRCLGRVALLQRALDAYQTEKADIAMLLSGTDGSATERLRR